MSPRDLDEEINRLERELENIRVKGHAKFAADKNKKN
jgi:hypothetical protein